MAHFVVVGGGIAGLTAANALIDSGAGVTLFEQSRHLGGRARTLGERGFLLNFGPHALYRGAVAEQTFANWKLGLKGGDPGARARNFAPQGSAGVAATHLIPHNDGHLRAGADAS